MGEFHSYHCTKCSWSRMFQLGTGMLPEMERDLISPQYKISKNGELRLVKKRHFLSAEERAAKGKYGLPLKAFAEADTPRPVDSWEEDAIYYCTDCHTFKQTKILEMQYDYDGSIIKVSVAPYCSKCEQEMKRIDKYEGFDSSIELCCPKCGEPVEMGGLILFD